jgi:hypothetical protein
MIADLISAILFCNCPQNTPPKAALLLDRLTDYSNDIVFIALFGETGCFTPKLWHIASSLIKGGSHVSSSCVTPEP